MKYLSLTAIVYAALFVINLFYGNSLTLIIQSGLGAALFVAIAIYLNAIDEENLTAHTKFEQEINSLRKELKKVKSE